MRIRTWSSRRARNLLVLPEASISWLRDVVSWKREHSTSLVQTPPKTMPPLSQVFVNPLPLWRCCSRGDRDHQCVRITKYRIARGFVFSENFLASRFAYLARRLSARGYVPQGRSAAISCRCGCRPLTARTVFHPVERRSDSRQRLQKRTLDVGGGGVENTDDTNASRHAFS